MDRLVRIARWFSVAWALAALALATSGYSEVNDDARGLVLTATIISVVAAVGASVALSRGRVALGGVGLLLSAAAPTFGAAALNLLPIGFGLALIAVAMNGSRARSATPSMGQGASGR
jgi:hypothetical protein